MTNKYFQFSLDVGGIYKFDRKIPGICFSLYKTEKHAIEDHPKNVVGFTDDIQNYVFTVISNIKHPYSDGWGINNPSIVGIYFDNKKFYFRMPNNKTIIHCFGIERIYDVELSIKELASIFSTNR